MFALPESSQKPEKDSFFSVYEIFVEAPELSSYGLLWACDPATNFFNS